MRDRRRKPTHWEDAAIAILRQANISEAGVAGRLVRRVVLFAAQGYQSPLESFVEGELTQLLSKAALNENIDLSKEDPKKLRRSIDRMIHALRRTEAADVDCRGSREKIVLTVKNSGGGGQRPGTYRFRLTQVSPSVADPSAYWGATLRKTLYDAIEEVGFIDTVVRLDDLGEVGAEIVETVVGEQSVSNETLRPFTRGVAEVFANFFTDRLAALSALDAVSAIRCVFRFRLDARKITQLDFYPSLLRSIRVGEASGSEKWRSYADVIVMLPNMNIAEKLFYTKLLDSCSTVTGPMPANLAMLIRGCETLSVPESQGFEDSWVELDTEFDTLLFICADYEKAKDDLRRQLELVRRNPRYQESD